MGERETVHLYEVRHERHACWHRLGYVPAWAEVYVAVGQLADGRWYVDLVEQRYHPARLYDTDREAYTAARRVMAHYGPDWEPVPCYPTEEAQERMRQPATGSQE